jgi:hypothetical protein
MDIKKYTSFILKKVKWDTNQFRAVIWHPRKFPQIWEKWAISLTCADFWEMMH